MIEFQLNGEPISIDPDVETPLLYVLRNEAGQSGPKFGCGVGECGTCLVLVDGEPVNSCDLPVSFAAGREVLTVEGHEADQTLGALRQAFIDEQAAQCAYCSAGILIKATDLLHSNPTPSRTEIGEALSDQLCRCGAHSRVVRAIERVVSGETFHNRDPGPGLHRIQALDLPEGSVSNDHLAVVPDGTVLLSPGKVDLGQGITTSLAQIAADWLSVGVGRIRIRTVDTAFSPDEGTTSGSLSISVGGSAVRESARELRSKLLSLCSERLDCDIDDLKVVDGVVTAVSGRSTTYWEVLGGADAFGNSPGVPAVGTAIPRWDLPAKFSGGPAFIQDIDLPDMLHGRMVRSQSARFILDTVDDRRVRQMDGVVEVVRSGLFLGVVADGEDQAIRAARALENDASWIESPVWRGWSGSEDLTDRENETHVLSDVGEISPDEGVTLVSATYTRPYLAHASVAPSCAIAHLEDETLTVWSHTQAAYALRNDLARTLGIIEERIRVIHADGAGCYGHNGADDVALDAALMAVAVPGRAVRLQWSREDEFRWEPYGSAMAINLTAGLDSHGKIIGWKNELWSQTHNARPGRGETPGLLAASEMAEQIDPPQPRLVPLPNGGATRNGTPLYEVGDFGLVAHLVTESPIRTSALRSLGAHVNIFAIESFIDELAAEANLDPVEFRLRHLSDRRAIEVIEKVVELAGVPIGGQSDAGHGYGLGFAQYKNLGCYVAVVAEVIAEEEVVVPRIWAVADAGRIVNPNGAMNQIEGGIIQSTSWALREQASLESGFNATNRWSDYPILRFGEIPELVVEFIDRPSEPSVGVGEGAQGPTTAAIANALRAALGVPFRDLPFSQENVTRALL